MANTLLSKKKIVSVAILFGGLLVTTGVLISANLAAAQSSTTSQSVQWTQNAGMGISVPACSSASPSMTCSGGQPLVTFTGTFYEQDAIYINYPAPIWSMGGWEIMGTSVTVPLGILANNTSYTYRVQDWVRVYNDNTPFTTPNCGSAVKFRATLDGTSWSGDITYDVSAPSGNFTDQTRTVPIDLPNRRAGDYTYTYKSGGPVGATFTNITPSTTQTLPEGGTITFTFNFLSPPPPPPPPVNYTVTASIDSGSGTITGPGISCPGDCSESYPDGTWVTLIATPSPSYFFTNWTSIAGSVCGGQGSTCSALIDSDKTAGANFNVSPPPFNYSLSNSGPSPVTKTSGDAFTNNTITKSLTTGVTEPVTLSLSGVPAGVSTAISHQGCSPTCTSVITFTVPSSTPVGNYPITVTGSPLGKQTNFNLAVLGSPFSVSCSASPSPAFLGQTVTWTAVISGGTPPFSYSWSGTNIPTSPAPNTNPFSIVYSTIGPKTAAVTVTDIDSTQESCPTSIVQVKFDPSFEEF